MNTKVKIGPLLQEYLEIPAVLEVSGSTVGECLDDLIRQYPEIRTWLFDQNSLVRVLLSVNNAEIVSLDKEGSKRILKPNDELQIFAVVAGG
jgi:molybdopterin converting factor small subunit